MKTGPKPKELKKTLLGKRANPEHEEALIKQTARAVAKMTEKPPMPTQFLYYKMEQAQ